LLYRELNDEKTPLEGDHRIIDGYNSEYILASFKNGMYHGNYQYFKDNVLRDSANYVDGYKNGLCKKFDFQGKMVSSGEYTNGKLNGLFTTYNQQGQIETQQEFTMGIEDGFFHRYNTETGKISQEMFYKNGRPDSIWVQHYWSNICDYTGYSQFKNGRQIGDYTQIADNGTCILKGFYSEGKKDGLWIYKNEDGTPRKEITYKNDQMNGPFKYYYEDGTLKEEGLYEDNKIISSTEYQPNGRKVRKKKTSKK
jgi:antitoxin component YwqK of YwqJK toxin-antitoxin module